MTIGQYTNRKCHFIQQLQWPIFAEGKFYFIFFNEMMLCFQVCSNKKFSECHVNDGMGIKLQLPEHNVACKRDLKYAAITDSLTFTIT